MKKVDAWASIGLVDRDLGAVAEVVAVHSPIGSVKRDGSEQIHNDPPDRSGTEEPAEGTLAIPAQGRLIALHAHNEGSRIDDVLGLLAEGATVALVSDAGMFAGRPPCGRPIFPKTGERRTLNLKVEATPSRARWPIL